MIRPRCSCGVQHRRFVLDTPGGSVVVTGCPVCLRAPDAIDAMAEMLRAARVSPEPQQA